MSGAWSSSSLPLCPCPPSSGGTLTLPLLPALLPGVFRAPGAGQEPPGLALLRPLLLPVHTATQSSVSSQQQLQEDKIAAGRPAASQTVRAASVRTRKRFAGFFIVKFHRNGAGLFCFCPATPQLGRLTFRPGPSQNLQRSSLSRWLINVASAARFSFSFMFCEPCWHGGRFCSPFLSVPSSF